MNWTSINRRLDRLERDLEKQDVGPDSDNLLIRILKALATQTSDPLLRRWSKQILVKGKSTTSKKK